MKHNTLRCYLLEKIYKLFYIHLKGENILAVFKGVINIVHKSKHSYYNENLFFISYKYKDNNNLINLHSCLYMCFLFQLQMFFIVTHDRYTRTSFFISHVW